MFVLFFKPTSKYGPLEFGICKERDLLRNVPRAKLDDFHEQRIIAIQMSSSACWLGTAKG